MNSIKISISAISLLFMFASCSNDTLSEEDFSSNLETSIAVENDIILAEEVMEELNDYRVSIGLNPLNWHNDSENLAVEHSFYMVQKNKASHDNFYKRSETLQDGGARFVSENVAYGYKDAASVLQGWLNSPSHKSAIEGEYTHSGIGIVYTETGIPYYTQLFLR